MKLQQLKYLLAIVDNGLNITAAADRMYTSQPGVSKQLKLLEEELGLQLFARKGKSLNRITRAGEQVVRRARKIMEEVDQIRSLAEDFYKEEEGTLTIAATSTQARYVLPEILREVRAQYPKVRLNLHQGTAEQIESLAASSDIDFTIATDSEDRFSELLRLPGYQWDRVILTPKDHELTKLDRPITLNDLSGHPLVSYLFSFENDQSLKEAFAAEGLEANIVFTASDSDAVKTYVRMGLGIGIVASMAYEEADHQSLAAIPANGIFPRSTTWIGLRRNTVLRCYMAEFLRLFAPHLSGDQIERAARASSQREVDQLVNGTGMPVKNGYGSKLSAAA
jgi:LysR family cys regulon transcriptional activator